MKSIQFGFIKSWFTGFSAITLVMSCGIKQIEDKDTSSVTTTGGGRNNTVYVPEAGRAADWDRLCSKAVFFTSAAAIANGLEKYFFSAKNGVPAFPGEVRMLELPVNWCLKIGSGGSKAAFRIEYEDHYGGGWYEMSASKSSNPYNAATAPVLFHSEINQSANTIDIIFLDSQGFTQITGPKVGEYYEASIKFANLPSQAEYMAEQVEIIKAKCRSGEWTAYKCFGYAPPPTPWWKEQTTNPTSSSLQLAREMLSGGGGAEAGTIGTIRFRLSDLLY